MTAELTRLSCPSCGAPLAAGDFDLSVVCGYCRSMQKLTSEPAQARALEALDKKNRRLMAEAQELRLREDLRRTDDAWERFSRRFAGASKGYVGEEISDLGSYILALLAVVICTFLCASFGQNGFVASLIVAIGVCMAISLRHEKRRATEYENYRSRYQKKRSSLLEKIQAIKDPGSELR